MNFPLTFGWSILLSFTLSSCTSLKTEEKTITPSSAPDPRLTALAEKIAEHYREKTVIQDFEANLTLEEAQTIQGQVIQFLRPEEGEIVGYKAGLTNPSAQARFGVTQPLQGVFLEQMLLENGATLPVQFGSIPMIEGDLMVRVGSEAINQATTPAEVLASLDGVIPFLELPDLMYGKAVQLTGAKLQAINVGARRGVLGEVIPFDEGQDWQTQLQNLTVSLQDQAGTELGTGTSSALGEPLAVVLWLKERLQAEGIALKKGDLLSLGTITPLLPVTEAMEVRAIYTGLKPNQAVEVRVNLTSQSVN